MKRRGKIKRKSWEKIALVTIVIVIGVLLTIVFRLEDPSQQPQGCGNKCIFVDRDWQPGELIPLYFAEHHHAGQIFHGEYLPNTKEIANVIVTESGTWSEIFSNYNPGGDDVVLISEGADVTFDEFTDSKFRALVVDGIFRFKEDADTKITLETIHIYPTGKLIVTPNSDKHADIVFDGEVDTVEDPGQFNLGVIMEAGTVTIRGKQIETTHSKLAQPAQLGATSIVIEKDPLGWEVGDLLDIADTGRGRDSGRYNYFESHQSQNERVRITSINGRTIGIEPALRYSHDGYVGHLSRSVTFRSDIDSASASEANDFRDRAHLFLTGHGFVDIRYAAVVDMGRTRAKDGIDNTAYDVSLGEIRVTKVGTNHIARYPFHFHHLHEPATGIGNSIYGVANPLLGSPKLGYVCHSGYCIMERNVIVGAAGAGVFSEDGPEHGSFRWNYVSGTGYGSSGRGDTTRPGGLNENPDVAHGGFGYWFRGPFMKVRDNVAAGYFALEGYAYFNHNGYRPDLLISPDVPGIPEELVGRQIQTTAHSINDFGGFERNIFDGIGSNAALAQYYNTKVNVYRDFEVRMIGTSGRVFDITHSQQVYFVNPKFTSVEGGIEVFHKGPGNNNRMSVVNGDISGFSGGDGYETLNSEPSSLPDPLVEVTGIEILSPIDGGFVTSGSTEIVYEVRGDVSEVDHIVIRVDNGDEIKISEIISGSYSLTNLGDGDHTLYVALRDSANSLIGGPFSERFSSFSVITTTVCGNGIIEPPVEACDDGENNARDKPCSSQCIVTKCGDAVVQKPNGDLFDEECDDGNRNNGDGCSSLCVIENEGTTGSTTTGTSSGSGTTGDSVGAGGGFDDRSEIPEIDSWTSVVSENDREFSEKGEVNVVLAERSRVDLSVFGSDIYVGVRDIFGDTSALIEIQTTPVTRTQLTKGSPKRFDIDGDGVLDVEVNLDGIDSQGRAILDVKSISVKEVPDADGISRAKNVIWIVIVILLIVAIIIVAFVIIKKRGTSTQTESVYR